MVLPTWQEMLDSVDKPQWQWLNEAKAVTKSGTPRFKITAMRDVNGGEWSGKYLHFFTVEDRWRNQPSRVTRSLSEAMDIAYAPIEHGIWAKESWLFAAMIDTYMKLKEEQ